MKKTLRNILVAALTVTLVSWAVAVNDDGGGGGGVHTQRTAEESRQLLQEYREQREALRHSAATDAPSYGLSAGNASQLSMSHGAHYEPSLYTGSAGNASQVSMTYGALHEPSLYTGSAGNASQLSMGQVSIGAGPGAEGYGVGGPWPQTAPVSSDATLIEALEALGIVVA